MGDGERSEDLGCGGRTRASSRQEQSLISIYTPISSAQFVKGKQRGHWLMRREVPALVFT